MRSIIRNLATVAAVATVCLVDVAHSWKYQGHLFGKLSKL